MPARPELSSFSFSSRIGTPTLLARMGHGSRSPFTPLGEASSLQQQAPVTPQHSSVTDAQMPDPDPLTAAVGENVVNSTDPRGLQPANSAGQTQPMDLDVVGVQLSPDSWGTKSPLPLNALALNDLWADADRVQNEWASVERTPVVPPLSPTKTRQKAIDSTLVNVPAPISPQPPTEGRQPSATIHESSHTADSASTASTNLIKQENDIVKKEELETRIKKEDNGGSLAYLISSSIGQVTSSALLNQEPKILTHRSPDLQPSTSSQGHERNAISAITGLPIPTHAYLPERTEPSSSSQVKSMGSYLPTTLKENSYRAGQEQLLGPGAKDPGARQASITGTDVSHSTLLSDNASHHPEVEESLASTPRNSLPVHAYQAPAHRERSYNRPSNPNTIGRPSPGLRASLRAAWASPMDSPPIGPRNYRGVERPPRNQRSPPPHLCGSPPLAYFQRDPRTDIRGDPYTSPSGLLGRRHVRSRSPSPYQTSRRRSESPNRRLRSMARGRSPPPMPGRPLFPRHPPVPCALSNGPILVTTSPLSNRPPSPRSFSHNHSPPMVPLRHLSSDGYLRSPAPSGSRIIGRGRTPHHFTRNSPPRQKVASLRRSHAASSAPRNGFSDSYARAGSDQGNYRSKDRLQEDRTQTSPRTPEGRFRYEPQHAHALKRTLVDAGLHDEASDKYRSSTVDFSPRQRRRIGSLDRGSDHSAAIVADSPAPKEFLNGQVSNLSFFS